MKKLIIVESPGKVKTIQGYLDHHYTVTSSYGHVRDLPKSQMGVDVAKGFEPTYVVTPEQKSRIASLRKLSREASHVYLASDDDREGEAIAWHIKEALQLKEGDYERIVFHEITKSAVKKALNSPRGLDQDLIEAQQARRILDRLVGYSLSQLLWLLQGGLSAGRVQSVAVRLVVEKEREIHAFVPEATFKGQGVLQLTNGMKVPVVLPTPLPSLAEGERFLAGCSKGVYQVLSVERKRLERAPQPPFITSTLQQAAANQLGFSVDKTMMLVQKLYEGGNTTYMRTDSLRLSLEALKAIEEVVRDQYGKEYLHVRQYKNKRKTVQDAHEAIRPTVMKKEVVAEGDTQRLYALIRDRVIASQMSCALFDKTKVTIGISTRSEQLVALGEELHFPGFLAALGNQPWGSKILPPLAVGDELELVELQVRESFSRPPARYSEAMLVKKLESLGIGRPSTYRPTISAIQKRGYVEKDSRSGKERTCALLAWKGGKVVHEKVTERVGSEKHKLYPTNVALLINDFLMRFFGDILDYQFTANAEEKLDAIAQKKLSWHTMLGDFYPAFEAQLKKVKQGDEVKAYKVSQIRYLGDDPKTKKPIWARLSRRTGPLVQMGSLDDNREKQPRFASLRKGQFLEKITLEEALKLFTLPRNLGMWEGDVLTVNNGRFGPYIKHQGKFVSLGKEHDPYTITQEEAVTVVEQYRQRNKVYKCFDEDPTIEVRNGRFGAYIKTPKCNIKIPAGHDPATLTWEICQTLIAASYKKKSRARRTTKRKKAKGT